MADTVDLGSTASAWGFESLQVHQNRALSSACGGRASSIVAHCASEACAEKLFEVLFVGEAAQFSYLPDWGQCFTQEAADAGKPVVLDCGADGGASERFEIFLQ